MGQRANYLIKDHHQLTIYYHHWRANFIVTDLYLGEQRFIAFVEACQVKDELMEEPWIEGCVFIDKPAKQLYFWALDFSDKTSVIDHYLTALAQKWPGWGIHFLSNRMYDLEKVLGIDYVSKQEIFRLDQWSKEAILADQEEEWTNAVVVIRHGEDLFVPKTGPITAEIILGYGQAIIPLLREKPATELPNEAEDNAYACLVIDTRDKKLFLSESAFGLWEQCRNLWEVYAFTMGDFGYIGTLRMAGIEVKNLVMPQDQVLEEFHHIISRKDRFDPAEAAKKLAKDGDNVQFHPDFFNNVKPLKTLWERLKIGMKKILGK